MLGEDVLGGLLRQFEATEAMRRVGCGMVGRIGGGIDLAYHGLLIIKAELRIAPATGVELVSQAEVVEYLQRSRVQPPCPGASGDGSRLLVNHPHRHATPG